MEAISGLMKVVGPIIQGVGVIGNFITGNRNAQAQQAALNEQKQLAKLAGDPAAFNARIRALEQPLSEGLTSDVGNSVQGYLAERGLSESPAIQASQLAQALGPYQLQEQQLAENAVLAPYQISPPNQIMQGSNTSGLYAGNPYGLTPPKPPQSPSPTSPSPGQVPTIDMPTSGEIPYPFPGAGNVDTSADSQPFGVTG